MSSAINFEKATWTACCIIPPQTEENWGPIQKIREKYDSAYQRWMPHINLFFPFVHDKQFSEVKPLLEDTLKEFPAFEIVFDHFDFFDHGKKCVLFLKPSTTDSTVLQQLYNTMLKVLPGFDDALQKSKDGQFHAHLTVGQFSKQDCLKKKQEFENDWKPIHFTVDHINVIARQGTTSPMSIKFTIPLKK